MDCVGGFDVFGSAEWILILSIMSAGVQEQFRLEKEAGIDNKIKTRAL